MHRTDAPTTLAPAIYVAVRTDLSARQQIVQAVHAGIAAATSFPPNDTSPFLVVLAADDLADLQRMARRALDEGVRLEMFYEDDDDLGVTAFGTELLAPERRCVFKGERLWRE